jgi:hypothetical protein
VPPAGRKLLAPVLHAAALHGSERRPSPTASRSGRMEVPLPREWLVWDDGPAAQQEQPTLCSPKSPKSVEASSVPILTLPDDLLLMLDSALLSSHLPSAMRLAACCKRLVHACEPIVLHAKQRRRIRWESHHGHVVTHHDCRSLTRLGGKWTKTWAYGSLLPSTGRATWRVRIDRCAANEGVMCIGVCDEAGSHAYGISPYSCRLSSLSRGARGTIEANTCPPDEHANCTFIKALTADGSSLKGRANGALIELKVDADAGSVSFRVKSSRGTYTEPVEAISGLPAGVRLRPWARLFDVPDRVTISGFWWSTQTSRPEAGRVVRRRAGTLV